MAKRAKKISNKSQIHQHACKVTNYFYTDTASSFSAGLSMLLGNYGVQRMPGGDTTFQVSAVPPSGLAQFL